MGLERRNRRELSMLMFVMMIRMRFATVLRLSGMLRCGTQGMDGCGNPAGVLCGN